MPVSETERDTRPAPQDMTQLRAARLIALADLRRRVRTRTFFLTAVVGPLLLATIISLAFGGSSFDSTIGIVDDDGSPVSERFVDGVSAVEADGLSFESIGERMGLSRKSVRGIWARGLKNLKRSLDGPPSTRA